MSTQYENPIYVLRQDHMDNGGPSHIHYHGVLIAPDGDVVPVEVWSEDGDIRELNPSDGVMVCAFVDDRQLKAMVHLSEVHDVRAFRC